MLYHTAGNNYVFFKQVEPFVEVMIKHEPLDEALPHSDCTLYVTTGRGHNSSIVMTLYGHYCE
jgi:hypothetical protein